MCLNFPNIRTISKEFHLFLQMYSQKFHLCAYPPSFLALSRINALQDDNCVVFHQTGTVVGSGSAPEGTPGKCVSTNSRHRRLVCSDIFSLISSMQVSQEWYMQCWQQVHFVPCNQQSNSSSGRFWKRIRAHKSAS